jgi:WD40 repeat protein
LALSSDGRLVASGGEDRTIKIWEVTTGKLIRTLEGTKEAIQTIQFSPDDRLLLSGSGDFLSDRDGELSIWGVLSGQKSRFYIGFKGPVFSAAFSKDGQFVVSAGGDGQVYLWDARSEKLLSIYHGHRFQVQGVRFGHNPNAFISAGSEGVLNLWAKDKLFPLKTIKTNPGGTRALAISNDNRFLVSGGCGGGENGCQQGSIFLGTFDKEIATHEILGHLKYVTSVAISPDGKFVLSGSEDGTMKLWDVSEWTQPREARQ